MKFREYKCGILNYVNQQFLMLKQYFYVFLYLFTGKSLNFTSFTTLTSTSFKVGLQFYSKFSFDNSPSTNIKVRSIAEN